MLKILLEQADKAAAITKIVGIINDVGIKGTAAQLTTEAGVKATPAQIEELKAELLKLKFKYMKGVSSGKYSTGEEGHGWLKAPAALKGAGVYIGVVNGKHTVKMPEAATGTGTPGTGTPGK